MKTSITLTALLFAASSFSPSQADDTTTTVAPKLRGEALVGSAGPVKYVCVQNKCVVFEKSLQVGPFVEQFDLEICQTQCGFADNREYSPCAIHSGCVRDDLKTALWNGNEWTCSDDTDGTQSNNFDTCYIHPDCSMPNAWAEYDADNKMWVCCDELPWGCLPENSPDFLFGQRHS